MAIFEDERPGRAVKALAAIAMGGVALLLTALFALPATVTAGPTAPPAHVAVGGEDTDDPGGECCSRGSTWDSKE